MAKIDVIGFKELDKVLSEFPRQIQKRAIVAAGRKAAKPIVSDARQEIKRGQYLGTYRTNRQRTRGNLSGFEHLRALAKMTKVVPYKGTVNVQIKGNDIPMASSRPFWNAYGVGRLFAFGRQNVGKGTRRKDTGYSDGFGDWITEAANRRFYESRRIYNSNILNELSKATQRAIKRYGKHY